MVEVGGMMNRTEKEKKKKKDREKHAHNPSDRTLPSVKGGVIFGKREKGLVYSP